jgi:hypothetical protein
MGGSDSHAHGSGTAHHHHLTLHSRPSEMRQGARTPTTARAPATTRAHATQHGVCASRQPSSSRRRERHCSAHSGDTQHLDDSAATRPRSTRARTHATLAETTNTNETHKQRERERSETAHSLTRADSAHGDTALCGRRRKPAPRHATRAGAHSAMHMGLQIWRRSNERQYATPDHSRAVQRSGRSGSHCPRDVATVRCIATSLAIATIILCDHNRPPPQPRSSTPRTPRRTGSSPKAMCRLWPVKAVCARALLSTYEPAANGEARSHCRTCGWCCTLCDCNIAVLL